MIAILGIIPAILVGSIFFIIDPFWSALWVLLLAGSALFVFKGRKRSQRENEC